MDPEELDEGPPRRACAGAPRAADHGARRGRPGRRPGRLVVARRPAFGGTRCTAVRPHRGGGPPRPARAARAHRPGATLLGLTDGATMGWSDELGGIFGSHPAQPGGVSRTGMRTEPAIAYEDVRDRIRAAQSEAEAESGRLQRRRGRRHARAAALHGWRGRRGRVSWRAGDDRARRGRGRGLRRARGSRRERRDRRGPRARHRHERAARRGDGRVLSTVPAGARAARARPEGAGGGGSRARCVGRRRSRHALAHGPSDRRVRAPSWRDSGPGGADPASRGVGPLDSIARTAERSQEVLDRVADTGAMAETRQRLADAGHQAPVSAITDALEAEAQRLEGMASTRPTRSARDLARQFVDTYGADGTIPPRPGDSRTRPALGRGAVAERAPRRRRVPRAPACHPRRARHLDRGPLGPRRGRAYREGRLDYQTARTAADQARAGGERRREPRHLAHRHDRGGRRPVAHGQGLLACCSTAAGACTRPALRATGAETLRAPALVRARARDARRMDQLAGRVSPELLAALRARSRRTRPGAHHRGARGRRRGFIPDEDGARFIPDEETAP